MAEGESAASYLASMSTRERAKELRFLRRLRLKELGWTVVRDTMVYAPDDHERMVMYSLAAAARDAGLPHTPEELVAWKVAEDATVGEPWRAPIATERAERVRTIDIDAAVAERGLRGHVESETALADVLAGLGVRPLSPGPGDPPFDIAWVHGDRFFVAEVKSLTRQNEEHQLRLGLGQVLRYRWTLAALTDHDVTALLVPELSPTDAAWSDVCASVDVVLLPVPRIATELPGLLR